MNGLPYYKAYPRDFIEGTIGMPFEVKCAYRVVLDLIYMQGGNLPDDERYISGLLGCSVRKWKSIRAALIEGDKLTVSGEFLTNKRADNELETLAKLQDKQRENRSRPNKNNKIESPRSDHTEPEPEVDTDVSTKKDQAKPDRFVGFDAFWEIWPNKTAKDRARKAWGAMSVENKRAAFSAVRAGWFEKWRASKPDANPIHPASFLNGKRWQDEFNQPHLKPIDGGRTHGKRSVTERLAARGYFVDHGEDRDPSEPFSDETDERGCRGSGDHGLGEGPVGILPFPNLLRM